MKKTWLKFRTWLEDEVEDHKFGKALTAYARLVCVHQFVSTEEWPFTYYYYSWKFKGLVKVKLWATDDPMHKCRIVYPEVVEAETELTKRHRVRGIGMVSLLELSLMDVQFEIEGKPHAG